MADAEVLAGEAESNILGSDLPYGRCWKTPGWSVWSFASLVTADEEDNRETHIITGWMWEKNGTGKLICLLQPSTPLPRSPVTS